VPVVRVATRGADLPALLGLPKHLVKGVEVPGPRRRFSPGSPLGLGVDDGLHGLKGSLRLGLALHVLAIVLLAVGLELGLPGGEGVVLLLALPGLFELPFLPVAHRGGGLGEVRADPPRVATEGHGGAQDGLAAEILPGLLPELVIAAVGLGGVGVLRARRGSPQVGQGQAGLRSLRTRRRLPEGGTPVVGEWIVEGHVLYLPVKGEDMTWTDSIGFVFTAGPKSAYVPLSALLAHSQRLAEENEQLKAARLGAEVAALLDEVERSAKNVGTPEAWASLRRECLAAREKRARIRRELLDWMVGDLDPADVGLFNGRRVVAEIDRICPEE
jgi:hypothetical protein